MSAMRAVGAYKQTEGGDPTESAAGKISSLKPSVVQHALRCGVDVLVSDLDVAFFANPLDFLPDDDADVAAMSDGVDEDGIYGSVGKAADQSSTCCEHYPERFDVYERHSKVLNSGLFHVRRSPATIAAFGRIAEHLAATPGLWDQAAFNDVALPRGSRYGLGLRVRILQPHLFCNSFFYDTRVRGKLPFRPVAVHANYVISARAKQELLVTAIRELATLPLPPSQATLDEMDHTWDGWWAVPSVSVDGGMRKDPPLAAADDSPRALQPARSQ